MVRKLLVHETEKAKAHLSGHTLAQKIISAKKKKVHGIHEKVNSNAMEGQKNHQLLFCGKIYDDNAEVWREFYPGHTPNDLIRRKIPHFLDTFFKGHLPRIGMIVSYPKTREDLEKDLYFQLGLYDKNSPGIEMIYNDPIDNRTWSQKLRKLPITGERTFSHFFYSHGTHMLSEYGKAILEQYAKLNGWKGGFAGASKVHQESLDKFWGF